MKFWAWFRLSNRTDNVTQNTSATDFNIITLTNYTQVTLTSVLGGRIMRVDLFNNATQQF